MAALRVGLIGLGGISGAHLAAYTDFADKLQVTAVCDPVPERVAAYRERFPQASAYADYRELLARPDVDCVDCCLPHALHYPVAKAALEAGKHVLVEKPFVNTYAQARDLVEIANRKQRIVMVAQHQRYQAVHRAVHDQIVRGDYGRVHQLRIDAIQNLHDYYAAPHWLYRGDMAGGGAVISVLVHKIDLLRYWLTESYGEATEVVAWGRTHDPDFHAAEDTAVGLIRFGDGPLVEWMATYTASGVPYCESVWLFAERAMLYGLPPERHYATSKLRIGWRKDGKSAEQFEELTYDANAFGLPTRDPMVNEILHFAECIEEQREPLSSGRDNLGTMAIIDGIHRSMREGGRTVYLQQDSTL
jgi:predicted dehydrogenase